MFRPSFFDEPAAAPPRRTLVIDIETEPATAVIFRTGNQFVNADQIVTSGGLYCFAAKWLDEPEMMFFSKWDDGEEVMARAAHRLFCEADELIHFNGVRFDEKHMNSAFLKIGLAPPSAYKSTDLWTVSKQFAFESGKLAYLSQILGLDGKLSHEGIGLWKKCMAGDREALDLMRRYNEQDVVLTEEVYHELTVWRP